MVKLNVILRTTLAAALLAGALQTYAQKISIIPAPVSITEEQGTFALDNTVTLSFDKENLQSLAGYAQERIKAFTGLQLASGRNAGGAKQVKLVTDAGAGKVTGAYTLDVTPSAITIRAAAPEGMFYGLQTLLQLLPVNGTDIPCVAIKDEPRFQWRGLMLDVSRHFYTIAEVKRMIDEMVEYKFNLLHLHLTDDQGWRLEIKSLPELTRVGAWSVPRTGLWWDRQPPKDGEKATYGGFYTQEDIRGLLRYASERHVQVLPEIDVPGHSLAAIAAYPYLSTTNLPYKVNPGSKFYGIEDNALSPIEETTYEFLDKVFTEVAALFPFEYIHIGGDECYKGFWEKSPECLQFMKTHHLKNAEELQSYFVKRVEKILESKGKKLLGWDEILEGGLAPSATVMSWRGMEGGIAAARAGHKVVMSPNSHVYLDLYQGDPAIEPPTYSMLRLKDVYDFEPVPAGISPEYILGGQGNLWTESVPVFRHAEYMLWPRAMALSEVLWSPPAKHNWNAFISRMEQQFPRLDKQDINYSRSAYDAIIKPSKDAAGNLQISLDTEIDGLELYYTFDNTYPDSHSPLYKKGSVLSIPTDADTFRVITYRDGKPAGRMITVTLEALLKRVRK